MNLRNKKTGESINIDKFPKNLQDTIKICAVYFWRDYEICEPAEPLIEDPKIRRELSDWIALYGEHEKIKYYRYKDFVVFRLSRKRGTPEPEISLPIIYECDSLREGKEYTKPELCGGEEC